MLVTQRSTVIENTTPSSDLMYPMVDMTTVMLTKDINCMFPIDRIHELAAEGFIRACAPVHAGFMGGGGTRRNSNTRLVRPSRRCSKKRMLTQSSSPLAVEPATALQYWCRERLKKLEFLQSLLQLFRRLFVRPVLLVQLLRWFLWELTLVDRTMLNSRHRSLRLLLSS